jgi:DinB superfamily
MPTTVPTPLQRANQLHTEQVERLLNDLKQYDHDHLNRPAAHGGWSVIQNLYHLMLSESLSLAYVRKKMAHETQFEPGGFSAWWRGLLLKWYLRLPFKFKAPPAVGGKAESLPASATLEEATAQWLKIRADWAAFFETLPTDLAKRMVYKHPYAGRVSWMAMLSFFAAHMERHKRQIKRTLR